MRTKFEDTGEHCDTVNKFMKYFSTKMMNKQAWWIDPFHLPLINKIRCESMSYEDNMYRFNPWTSRDPYIRNVPKENVPTEIRSIMDKADCNYISFCTTDHNYGSLMTYSRKGMRYNKSLDPEDIDKDEFAQLILNTLVDQKYILDSDEFVRTDYRNTIAAKEIAKKYNL